MSLTAETGVFHFKVDDHSFTKEIAGVGECFQSMTFAVGGYDWAVRYYPCYTEYEPIPWISLVLLSKPGGNVGVRFEFMLVYDSGKTSTELVSFDSLFDSCGQEEEVSEDIIVMSDDFVLQFTIAVLKKPFVPSRVCAIL